MKNTKSKNYCIIASIFLLTLLIIAAAILYYAELLEVIRKNSLFVNSDEILRRLALYKWLIGGTLIYLVFFLIYDICSGNRKLRKEKKYEEILLQQMDRDLQIAERGMYLGKKGPSPTIPKEI